MNMNSFLFLLFFSFLFVSCTDSKKEKATDTPVKEVLKQVEQQVEVQPQEQKELSAEEELVKGLELMEANCYSCHSPSASQAARSAPPMEEVKRYYINEGTTQEQFIRELIAFVSNPSKERAKMKSAVEYYGLMSKMDFSEDKIKKVANYIYNSELEKPTWFEEYYKAEQEKK